MPNILRAMGYSVYFWSNEGNPLEPVHVHISQEPHADATKVWILENGDCEIANNNSHIPNKLLNKLVNATSNFSDEIIDEWEKRFGEIRYIDEKSVEEEYDR